MGDRTEVDGGGRVRRRGALGRETAVAAGFLGSRRGWDGTEGVDAVRCERGSGECSARARSVSSGRGSRGLGRGGGAARGKRNRRPMDAPSTRGRRSDGGGDWRGDSRRVTAPGAVKRRARGLGAGDARVIDGRLAFEPGLTET